jgi:hypothetical protein
LAALFLVAWLSGRHAVAVWSIPLFAAMLITAHAPVAPEAAAKLASHLLPYVRILAWPLGLSGTPLAAPGSPFAHFIAAPMALVLAQRALVVVPYVLFILYPLLLGERAKRSLAPYIAAVLASIVLLFDAWGTREDACLFFVNARDFIGGMNIDFTSLNDRLGLLLGLPVLFAAALLFLLLWSSRKLIPREPRLTLLAWSTLAFLNMAIPLLLPKVLVAVVMAAEAALLAWLFTRLRHPSLLAWSTGLTVILFAWLVSDADLYARPWWMIIVFGAAAGAAFYAAWLARRAGRDVGADQSGECELVSLDRRRAEHQLRVRLGPRGRDLQRGLGHHRHRPPGPRRLPGLGRRARRRHRPARRHGGEVLPPRPLPTRRLQPGALPLRRRRGADRFGPASAEVRRGATRERCSRRLAEGLLRSARNDGAR